MKIFAHIFAFFLSIIGIAQAMNISTELEEEISNCPLQITGTMPTWLSGTLVRTSPIKVFIDGECNHHWFDGLAMLHAFSFQNQQMNYSNRFLRTDAYQKVFHHKNNQFTGFAQDPCRSLFKNLLSLFFSSAEQPLQNANVNVGKVADSYISLTEVPLPVEFDLTTLQTLGAFNYDDTLPKKSSWESAHPHVNQETGEILNYLIKFGWNTYYIIYRIQKGAVEREIISEIPVDKPSYMHSFAITENYIILTEYPLIVNPVDLAITTKPFIKNYYWHPQQGTRLIVIDRNNGHLIGKYTTKPFFAFHHVNAFEEERRIHLDLIAYHDADILMSNHFYHTKEQKTMSFFPHYERLSLNLNTGDVDYQSLLPLSMEFPRINDTLDGLPYRYFYAAGFNHNPSNEEEAVNSNALYKVDTWTQSTIQWSEEGCSPGEPVFVKAPETELEDDGVILSVVIDHAKKNSFLLILDAHKFEEIARAQAPHLIPRGFHGQYFE